MGVFARDGAAHGGGVDADFLGHILDHHGAQTVQSQVQELVLAALDDLANAQDGLLALLDVLHQLDGRCIAFADVFADLAGGVNLGLVVLVGCRVPLQHALVLGVEAQLRQVVVVHLDDEVLAVPDVVDVRLHSAVVAARILDARTGVESADRGHRDVDVLLRAPHQLAEFLELPGLQHLHVVGNDLPGHAAAPIPAFDLQQKAFAQVARTHACRFQPLDGLERRFHCGRGEVALLRHFLHGCQQIAVLVQVADDGFRRIPLLVVEQTNAQLGTEVVRQCLGGGQKSLERRLLHLLGCRTLVAGV